MNLLIPAVIFTAASLAVTAPGARGSESGHEHTHEMSSPDSDSCDVAILITEEAERQPGGANYEAPGQGQAMGDGDGHDGSSHQSHSMSSGDTTATEGMSMTGGSMSSEGMQMESDDMKGAHMDHAARHDGELLMAGTKLHHIEATYSMACGVRVYMYNAFTKPISVGRFQGFVLVVPEDEDRFYEAIRFLTPSEDGSCLQANLELAGDPPHEVELYLKFPGSDEPEVFSVFFN